MQNRGATTRQVLLTIESHYAEGIQEIIIAIDCWHWWLSPVLNVTSLLTWSPCWSRKIPSSSVARSSNSFPSIHIVSSPKASLCPLDHHHHEHINIGDASKTLFRRITHCTDYIQKTSIQCTFCAFLKRLLLCSTKGVFLFAYILNLPDFFLSFFSFFPTRNNIVITLAHNAIKRYFLFAEHMKARRKNVHEYLPPQNSFKQSLIASQKVIQIVLNSLQSVILGNLTVERR